MSFLAPAVNGPIDVVNDLSAEPFYIMAEIGEITGDDMISYVENTGVSEEAYLMSSQTTN